ncbi:MAG TPA: autotransporter-associated beta strand repeat-containing protein, partial [Luteolibacter sp.]
GFTKSGSGTLILSGANSGLTGGIRISQGTLVANGNTALGTNNITLGDINSGAAAIVLKFDTGISSPLSTGTISTSNFGASQTILLNAGSALGANANAFSGTLNLAGSVGLTVQATNTGGHSTAQDWTGNITGTGIASGTTALTLNGVSTTLRMTFGGTSQTTANTFTGDVVIMGNVITQNTTFSGNIASRQNMGFLNNNVTVNSGAGWTLVWGGETVQNLNGSGNIVLNNQNALNNIGLTIGNNNATGGSYSGGISGGFGVAKVGTGTQTLTGGNSYTGGTNVSGGTLTVGAGGTLNNTSAITIASGATLNLSGSANNQLAAGVTNGTLAINGTLNATTNFAHTLAFGTSYFANISMNNGTLANTFGTNTSGFGAFYIGASRTITATGTNTISGTGVIGLGSGAVLTLSP